MFLRVRHAKGFARAAAARGRAQMPAWARPLLVALCAAPSAAIGPWGGLGQNLGQRRQAEVRSAKLVTAAATSAAAYVASGTLTKTWQPGGMAVRALKRPLLATDQRVAASLAAAALLTVAVGSVAEGDSELSRGARWVGRQGLRVTDSVRDRWEARGNRRRAEEQQRWLREHTSAARIVVPGTGR